MPGYTIVVGRSPTTGTWRSVVGLRPTNTIVAYYGNLMCALYIVLTIACIQTKDKD